MKTLARVPQRQEPPQGGFRKEPILEGRALSQDEVKFALRSLSKKSGESLANRFLSARDRLEREYGASIDIVERPCDGRSVGVSFEFMTRDRTLDMDKAELVFMAGFSLALASRPMIELPPEERYVQTGRFLTTEVALPPGRDGVCGIWVKRTPVYEQRMERRYIITQRRYASEEFPSAAKSAEALLDLLENKLKLPKIEQDVPDNIVPITQRPPRPKMDSGFFEADGAVRSQVS